MSTFTPLSITHDRSRFEDVMSIHQSGYGIVPVSLRGARVKVSSDGGDLLLIEPSDDQGLRVSKSGSVSLTGTLHSMGFTVPAVAIRIKGAPHGDGFVFDLSVLQRKGES